MAEETKSIKIKVTFEGDSKGAKEAAEEVKKSVKETGDEIGFADTKVGKMWGTFTDGVGKGIKSMTTLKGAIAATGIGVLLLAITSLVSYFTKTGMSSTTLSPGMLTPTQPGR